MKKICVLLVSIVLAVSMSSCTYDTNGQVFNNDWSYTLPNNYAIWHINSRNIVLGKENSKYSLSYVVEKHVIEFCFNNEFVGIKRVDVPKDLSIEIDTSNPEYYLIDIVNDIKYGPYKESEYLDKCEELKIIGLSLWIKTQPRPDGATFP